MNARRRNVRARGRSVWAVDAENANLTSDLTTLDPQDIAARMDLVRHYGGYRDGDHTVIGASHRNALAAGLACPTGLLVVGSGPDGADRAIQSEIAGNGYLDRFERLVIVSGDAGFIPLAEQALTAGLVVTVVSMRRSLSSRWLLTGAEVVPVPDHHPASAIAAVA